MRAGKEVEHDVAGGGSGRRARPGQRETQELLRLGEALATERAERIARRPRARANGNISMKSPSVRFAAGVGRLCAGASNPSSRLPLTRCSQAVKQRWRTAQTARCRA